MIKNLKLIFALTVEINLTKAKMMMTPMEMKMRSQYKIKLKTILSQIVKMQKRLMKAEFIPLNDSFKTFNTWLHNNNDLLIILKKEIYIINHFFKYD